MDAAGYAAMSDPERNWQFSRGWTDPPDTRKRRPGQGGAPMSNSRQASNIRVADKSVKIGMAVSQ